MIVNLRYMYLFTKSIKCSHPANIYFGNYTCSFGVLRVGQIYTKNLVYRSHCLNTSTTVFSLFTLKVFTNCFEQ